MSSPEVDMAFEPQEELATPEDVLRIVAEFATLRRESLDCTDEEWETAVAEHLACLLYTSPSPRDS